MIVNRRDIDTVFLWYEDVSDSELDAFPKTFFHSASIVHVSPLCEPFDVEPD